MVSVHSDLDDAGELITPTPKVKRILSSSRCLPHIAQVCLFETFYQRSVRTFSSSPFTDFKSYEQDYLAV